MYEVKVNVYAHEVSINTDDAVQREKETSEQDASIKDDSDRRYGLERRYHLRNNWEDGLHRM